MRAKIDIDALKSFTKSRTNETEYRQKIKNSQSRTQDLPILKRKRVLWLAHFWKFLKPKDPEFLLTYKFTHQQLQGGALRRSKNCSNGNSCSYFTLIQKYN